MLPMCADVADGSRRSGTQPRPRLTYCWHLDVRCRERGVRQAPTRIRIKGTQLFLQRLALQEREVRPPDVTVEPILLTPRLQQAVEVADTESAVGQWLDERLIAQVLNDLVHEREARRGDRRHEIREVMDNLTLRPSLACILGRE